MSNYTISIAELYEDPAFNLFDFKYPFYTEDIYAREEFQQLFIDNTFFMEIGYETVYKFKNELKALLRLRMPYYTELYKTILRTEGIDFMLNKDYTETFIRETENNLNRDRTNTTNSNGETTSSASSNSNTTSNSKDSSLDNGNAVVSLENGYLTSVNQIQDSSSNSANEAITNNINQTGADNTTENNRGRESTTLIGKGNIGVTSSAKLLSEWREVIININEMIIEECKDKLFLKIY